MSQKLHTTAIGLFIVAGVALGVTGVLLFSSSKLFRRTHEAILYFDDSLNGLQEGAAVKYRGVTIGSVKRVMIRFNQAPEDTTLPVLIQLDEELLRERIPDESLELFTARSFEGQLRGGLRGTLESESLLTGVLYVNLGFRPKAPPPVFHQVKKIYAEIPTVPTDVQRLMNNLASLDIKNLEDNVNTLLANLNTTVSNLNVPELGARINKLLDSANRLLSSPEITNALAAVGPTLDQYRSLGRTLEGRIDPLADSVTHSLAEADRALVQFRAAADELRALFGPDAPLPNDLDQTLREVSNTLRSLSVLLDFLKQHPNALITGREGPEKNP